VATVAVLGLAAMASFAVAQRTTGPWIEPSSGFTHGREDQWRAAVDTALDHPVLGAGSEAYLRASAANQGSEVSRYAHDLPLEAWAELGPLGLLLVLALVGFTGGLVWRIRGDPRAWLVAPAAAAFLVANLVDWPWHLAGAGAMWAAALGACVAIDRAARP
jgi:O-antigen ligase